MDDKEPKFMKLGSKWINIRGGNIAFAEETKDFDGRACIELWFVGDMQLRVYNNFGLNHGKEMDALRWWLDKYSGEPLMDTYELFVKYQRENKVN